MASDTTLGTELMPVMSSEQALAHYQAVVNFTKERMKEGVDSSLPQKRLLLGIDVHDLTIMPFRRTLQ